MSDISCNKNSCLNCAFRKLSLLEGLSTDELINVNTNRTSKSYKAGEYVYKESDLPEGLICLKSGKVKITKSGIQDAILDFNKSVDFLGLESLVLNSPYSFSAIAIENTDICIIEKKHFLNLLQTNASFSLKIIKLLANISKSSNDRLLMLTQKHLRGRLAHSLLQLKENHGVLADKRTLNIQLKRADLAAYSSMNPSNAIRVLSQFVSEELIETNKRQIKILDIEGLKKISELG